MLLCNLGGNYFVFWNSQSLVFIYLLCDLNVYWQTSETCVAHHREHTNIGCVVYCIILQFSYCV